MNYSKSEIHGKPVYIVGSHNHVLEAWADIRREQSSAPLLITLDYHTDTHPAFLNYACWKTGGMNDRDSWREAAEKQLKQINFANAASVQEASMLLKNDEHIFAASGSQIIKGAFVIQYDSFLNTRSCEEEAFFSSGPMACHFGDPPERPFTYSAPDGNIFIVGSDCAVGCPRMPHTDDCTRQHADEAIEAAYLNEKFAIIGEMSPALGIRNVLSEPFILDIDLDYFRTRKAVQPSDPTTLHAIMRKAIAITIATEPSYVECCRLEGEVIDADFLLREVFGHIESSMRKEGS